MGEGQSTLPHCVIVLGMHRSGTSLVAGSLEAAGLYLGDVNHAATYNRKGNKENASIRDLNDRLLARADASWIAPPTGQVEWSLEDEGCARFFVEPYLECRRPWGFKDPRCIWTVEGWLRIVPGARLVGVFRHPSLVVRSLGARRGSLFVGREDALRLWCAYNAELFRLQRKYRFPLLHFDSAGVALVSLAAQLEHIGKELGLAGDPCRFYRDELVHQTVAESVESAPATTLYARLLAAWTRQAPDSLKKKRPPVGPNCKCLVVAHPR
ncbi:MAG: sulfotransferase [Chloroflexi bacterium]|nr:sulfotransferase [Chloroflexota bacterium]